nr:MAG TPA: hypothetical protein [Caudoviricetes sp.]
MSKTGYHGIKQHITKRHMTEYDNTSQYITRHYVLLFLLTADDST